MDKGEKLAEKALNEFKATAEDVKASSSNISNLTKMSNQQVNTLMKAVESLNKISEIALTNCSISEMSKNTSLELAEEAKELRKMVE